MKKSWIIAGLIALVIVVELVLQLGDGREAPAPDEPPPTAVPAAPQAAEPPAPSAPAGEAGTAEPEAPPLMPALEKTYLDPDACLAFADGIIKKGGTGYRPDDVAYVTTQPDTEIKTHLGHMVTEYISCKAVERQDYAACVDSRTLVPPNRVLPCEQVFSVFIVLRAHYIMRMRPEQVADLYSDLPRNVVDWMVAFMRVLAEQDAGACDRLSVDPLILGACRIATGNVEAPPAGELADAYHVIMALRSGQMAHLERANPGLAVELVHVLLGRKGVCEAGFNERMALFCASKKAPSEPAPDPNP